MVTNSSFRLANAILGLLIILLPLIGLTGYIKTILLIVFGLLIILFSLADTGRGQATGVSKTINEAPKS